MELERKVSDSFPDLLLHGPDGSVDEAPNLRSRPPLPITAAMDAVGEALLFAYGEVYSLLEISTDKSAKMYVCMLFPLCVFQHGDAEPAPPAVRLAVSLPLVRQSGYLEEDHVARYAGRRAQIARIHGDQSARKEHATAPGAQHTWWKACHSFSVCQCHV